MKTNNMNLKAFFFIVVISISGKVGMAQVTDNGMTNDFHKVSIGKIVFAKTEILKATTTADGLTNSFELGDDIYGRVYLAKSMTNELVALGGSQGDDAIRYRITVDGKSLSSSYFDGNIIWTTDPDVKNEWTTFQLALSPSSVEGYPVLEYQGFFASIWELSTGSHKVKYELIMKTSTKENVIASGEFNLNVTEAGKTTTGNKVCPNISWSSMDASALPEAQGLVEKAKGPNDKIIKVILIAWEWKEQRDNNGTITARWMNGKTIFQDLKTKLYYDIDALFVQESTNNGISYGATQYSPDGKMTYKVVYLPACVK